MVLLGATIRYIGGVNIKKQYNDGKSPLRLEIYNVKKMDYRWHDNLLIIKVLKGKVRVRVWARENYLEVSDFIIMNPYETYEIEGLTEDNRLAFIYFDSTFVEEYTSDRLSTIILCNTYYYRNNNQEKYQVLQRYIEQLTYMFETGEKLEKLISCSGVILSYLFENFDYLRCGIRFKRYSEKIINRYYYVFKSLFEMNSSGISSLKDVCENLDISYGHMRKDIRERYGFGYKWLRYSIMIKHATIMIATSNYSITYISDHCGFSDQKYLIQYFKEFYDLTPSEFREKFDKGSNEYNEIIIY